MYIQSELKPLNPGDEIRHISACWGPHDRRSSHHARGEGPQGETHETAEQLLPPWRKSRRRRHRTCQENRQPQPVSCRCANGTKHVNSRVNGESSWCRVTLRQRRPHCVTRQQDSTQIARQTAERETIQQDIRTTCIHLSKLYFPFPRSVCNNTSWNENT